MMANEVYLITHDSLSNIVSARAATNVLEKALKHKGFTSETISQQQMRDILIGPVLKELQLILPSEGVKRTVKQITQLLESAKVQPLEIDDSSAVSATPSSVESTPENGFQQIDEFYEEDLGDEKPANDLDQARLSPMGSLARAELAAEELEAIVVKFAQLEHIQLVLTAKRQNGEVLSARGNGFDLDSLSRLANMSLTLLERNGVVKSYHLEHSRYHLFLVPLGSMVMIIIATAELNVGEIYTKLSALKEGI